MTLFKDDIYEHFRLSEHRAMADYADAILELLDDETLPRALRNIPGAVSHINKIKSDAPFIKKLVEEGDFSLEEYRSHIAPLLTYLDMHVAPPGYYDAELDPRTRESKEEYPPALWVIEDNLMEYAPAERPYPKAEDYSKLREDIAAYERWRRSQLLPGDPDWFCSHYEQSMRMVRIQRNQEETKYGLREKFAELRKTGEQEPHVVIHDGPEGKIVVPQTMRSGQYWGNDTRWCISMLDEEANEFHEYNEEGPMFIYIVNPSDEERRASPDYRSFKFIFVNRYHELTDERDRPVGDLTEEIAGVPPMILRLHEAALKTLRGGELDYYLKNALRGPDKRRSVSHLHALPEFFGGPLTTDENVITGIRQEKGFQGSSGPERFEL